MSYYGVIFPEFWTGATGRQLRIHGKEAQLLGLYLATNRHANLLGLYRLLVDDVRHETGLRARAVAQAYAALRLENYATFDASSAFVWVRQMARVRLGLKGGEALDPDDKKVIAANRIYHALDANPFLGEFFDANRLILRLKKRRESVGVVVAPDAVHHMSGLPSPLEAPSKPDTEIRNREQKQKQKKARLTPHGPLRALIVDVVQKAETGVSFPDLKDLAKDACAKAGLLYDADVVGSALEQALARKAKAS